MNKSIWKFMVVLIALVLVSCSKNAENEHLPEYCQSYTGFAATASRDMFELLDDADYSVNRFNYLSVISEIELEFEMDDPNREIDLGGIQCFQNLTSLSLIGRSFKDISEISALSNIQSIELRNTEVVSIDSFKNLSKINNLVISDTKTLQNVVGVGEMTKLTTLDLSNNGLVNIGELNALVNLQNLYLNNNEIVYFPSINNLVLLETLDISFNNIIEIDDLSGLRSLKELNASNNDLCDISNLDDLESIETIDLSFNDLGCNGFGVSPNFDSLESSPNLTTLLLNDNNLTSIEGLRDRDISLEVLHLHNNFLTDITPIADYTDITELVLYNNSITNINDLSDMTGLTSIDLSGNNISDFSDLQLITNLTTIDLSDNNISVIPDISTSWPMLSVLDLHSNPLTDVSGVGGHPTLESLILYNCGLTTLENINNLPELSLLDIENPEAEALIDVVDRDPNRISIIRDSFFELPRLDIHEDHVLDLGFTFGPNVEIYNSIKDNITIDTINWQFLQIDVIDADSIQLPNLAVLDVSTNNLTNIDFILGNPNLTELYLDNNTITNLSVISGAATEDLDDLEIVHVRNNFVGNDITSAFIDLPRLDEVDLLNTAITSINGSFNGLDQLDQLVITGTALQSITDSFNNLYSDYSSDNTISFDSGRIGTISNSFNGGNYHSISIQNQIPLGGATTIVDSFNNVTIVDDSIGLKLGNCDFSTITGSFNTILSDIVTIQDCQVETIGTSFVAADIGVLDVSINNIENLPGLHNVTSLQELNISNNRLTTVAFIDSIPDLDTLDFTVQQVNAFTKTLTTIDGINNQPALSEFTGDLSAVTSVTGFKNTNISTLNLSSSNLSGSIITSIASDAMSGSPIDTLDLSGHALDDVAFLSNLTLLTDLSIGLDVPNLDFMIGLPFDTTLDFLYLENVSPLSDFTPLQTYDVMTTLTLPDNVTNINNLDNMDLLEDVILDPLSIDTITDSFNELPEFEKNRLYLDAFTNLTAITSSFDVYGNPNNTETRIVINGDYTITDSFHNALDVTILNNDGDVTPTFDLLSFTAMTQLYLEYGEYTTYDFLNGYAALDTLTIEDLQDDLSGLNNNLISQLGINLAQPTVSSLSYDIALVGALNLTSFRTGNIDIIANNTNFDITATNADVTINSNSVTPLNVNAAAAVFNINAPNVNRINLVSILAGDMIFHTPLLETLTTQIGAGLSADTLELNTSAVSVSVDIEATVLTINDNNLVTINSDNAVGDTIVVSTEADLTISHVGASLRLDYDDLQTVDIISGQVDDLIIDSSAFTTLDTSTVTIDTIDLTSDQGTVSLTGSDIASVAITNDSITNLTAVIPVTDVVVNGSGTTLTIDDTSSMTSLDLSAMTSLDTLDYGSSSIGDIGLLSTSVAMSLSGSTFTTITLANTGLTSLDLTIPSSLLSLTVSQTTLDINGTVDFLTVTSSVLDTLTFDALSDINTVNLNAVSTLTNLVSNDISIDTLSIETDEATLSVDAINSTSTTITGDSLTSAVIDVGVHDLTLNANTATLGLTATANQLDLAATSLADLTIDNSSTITTLNVGSASLATIDSGTASVTDLVISNTDATFDLSGSNIGSVTVTSAFSNAGFTIGTAPTLVLNTSSITPVVVTTSTDAIDITTVADLDLSGGALETVVFSIGSNDLTLDMDKPTLTASIEGTAGTVTLTGDDVDALSLVAGTNINTLEFSNLDIATLDTTGATVQTLDITTPLTTFDLTSPSTTTTTVIGDNLTSIDFSSSGTIDVTTNQATLTIAGTMATLNVVNPVMTALTVTGATIDTLDLTTANLSVFDSDGAVTTGLLIDTNQNNFDLTTDVSDVVFRSDPTNTLLFTTASTGSIALDTDTNQVDLDASSATVTITAENLVSLIGTGDDVLLEGFTSFALVLDVDLNTLDITDAGTLTSLTYTGVHSINNVTVTTGSIAIIDTNNIDITNLILNQTTTTPLDVTTLASDITITSTPLGGFTEVSVTYEGSDPLVVDYSELDISTLSLTTADTLSVTGTIGDITINGAAIANVTTTSLTNTVFTMNGTAVSTIDFASTTLLNSLTTLEIDSLSNANMADIISALDGPTLELNSPITLGDINTYFYTTEFDSLTAQEAIDNAYYNALRATAVDDSWAEVLLNEYMDHLDETTTRNEINTDTFQTVENYFQDYLTDAGLTEGDLAPGEDDTIRNAIQATLDDIAIIMDEPTLQAAKDAAIIADATTYATTETAAITFTIG